MKVFLFPFFPRKLIQPPPGGGVGGYTVGFWEGGAPDPLVLQRKRGRDGSAFACGGAEPPAWHQNGVEWDKISQNSLFSVHLESSQTNTQPTFDQAALIPLLNPFAIKNQSRGRRRGAAFGDATQHFLSKNKTASKTCKKTLFSLPTHTSRCSNGRDAPSRRIPEPPNPRRCTSEAAESSDRYPAVIKILGCPFLGMGVNEKRGLRRGRHAWGNDTGGGGGGC